MRKESRGNTSSLRSCLNSNDGVALRCSVRRTWVLVIPICHDLQSFWFRNSGCELNPVKILYSCPSKKFQPEDQNAELAPSVRGMSAGQEVRTGRETLLSGHPSRFSVRAGLVHRGRNDLKRAR